jgi:hypothetical protein
MLHTRISTVVGALVVAAAFFAAAPAPAAAHSRSGASADADSITGCLRKGDKPNTFTVTGRDGKTVTVMSQSVSLAGHVGHTVTLTGNTMSSSMGSIADSSSMHGMGDSMKMKTGGADMSGVTMQVTKLTMVSATCQ